MKFAIIGCGSIGSRHARNLISLGHEVYLYDLIVDKATTLARELNAKVYGDLTPADANVDAWIICTPPWKHLELAKLAITHRFHVFIEKPISHTMDGVGDLLKKANESGLTVAVGYQLRFDNGLLKMKELIDSGVIGDVLHISAEYGHSLTKWHPHEDYRKLYTAHRNMGGGIILDASHEIDYVRWLLGDESASHISCYSGTQSDLDIDVEDTADILIRIYSGDERQIMVNIHVDMTQQIYTRWCKVVGSKGDLIWSKGYDGFILHNCTKIPYTKNDPYLDEMKAFIDCVQNGPSRIDISALETLKIAVTALKASQELKALPL